MEDKIENKEKFNIDDVNNIENSDTTCPNPICKGNRYYMKIYCGKVIKWCSDCGHFEVIEN